jgi:hypothetical protein
MKRIVTLLGLGMLVLAGGCDGGDDGGGNGGDDTERPPEELNILRIAEGAPPLESSVLQFWAVRGESREGKLYFQNQQGERGNEYLSLKFESNTLVALPDGSPIAAGDSVLITVTVVDPARILFDFAPSGLRFNAGDPAELRIKYDEADRDFDDDGDEDAADDDIERQLSIWRQASPGEPFVRIGSAVVEDLEEIEADLTGFSRYAIAY